ncbi:asparagine synthetase B [Candidatus Bathyarchaeota archaeon]|nr:asparagine synthetase B [Candidatus Bathyarchaeota archaeon]
MRTAIAVLNKNEGNSVIPLINALKSLRLAAGCYVLATPTAIVEADSLDELRKKNMNSTIVVGCAFTKSYAHNKPLIAKMENATLMFNGQFYPSTKKISLVQRLQLEHENIIEKLLKETESDFSLLVAESKGILAARDSIGVQPLYYGENAHFAALASNMMALWRLGVEKTKSFPPGNLARVSKDGFEFRPIKTLEQLKPKKITLEKAAQTLQKLMEHSIRIRVNGEKEVAVAFSGGLDSSVVAFLTKKCGANVRLVHVSLHGQRETEEAKKAADDLNLPLSCFLFEKEDVEKTTPKVVELIEDPDPVKVAVGIPFYWVAKKTAESGLSVLLAGQGADEIFGGYQRYVNEYLSQGAEKLRHTMFTDVIKLHENNIERDEKICGFNNVELRLPFASFQVVEFALSLPIELKIEKKSNGLRKIVLRKMAKNVGLPPEVVEKPKRAVQYSTGVNVVLGKIARKHGRTINEYIKMLFSEQMQIVR